MRMDRIFDSHMSWIIGSSPCTPSTLLLHSEGDNQINIYFTLKFYTYMFIINLITICIYLIICCITRIKKNSKSKEIIWWATGKKGKSPLQPLRKFSDWVLVIMGSIGWSSTSIRLSHAGK